LLKTGHHQSKIVYVIGVHISTISQEVKRNNGKELANHGTIVK